MNIEWDEIKNQTNIVKHGIDFDARVFADPLRKEYYDIFHSRNEEDRTIVIGIVESRMLFVSFTEPDPETIRLISARKVNKQERRYYYGNH